MIPTNIGELLDPDGDVAQVRMARMVLSHLTGDPLLSGLAFTEINTDPRGAYVALSDLILALTDALSSAWTATGEREALIGLIREQIARAETKEQA